MNGPRICTQPCNARRHTCCRAAAPHLRPTRKNASRKRRRDVRDNVANGGPLAIGPLAGGEQMVVGLLRLRFAAGVCVLAAGLLMGAGGAIAVADPDARGSTAHGDHETNTSGRQNSTGPKKPKHEPGATTSGTGANAPDPRPKKPKDEPGATTSGTGANAPDPQPKKPKDEPGATTSGTGANAPDPQPKKPKDEPGATTVAPPHQEPAPPQSEPAPPQSEPARPQSELARPQSELARRLLMWSPRFLVWRRQLRMWSRRYPIWSRQFLTSSR